MTSISVTIDPHVFLEIGFWLVLGIAQGVAVVLVLIYVLRLLVNFLFPSKPKPKEKTNE